MYGKENILKHLFLIALRSAISFLFCSMSQSYSKWERAWILNRNTAANWWSWQLFCVGESRKNREEQTQKNTDRAVRLQINANDSKTFQLVWHNSANNIYHGALFRNCQVELTDLFNVQKKPTPKQIYNECSETVAKATQTKCATLNR